MRIALALILLGSAGSKYVVRDLDKIEVQYLVVAPPAFADSLDLLLDHRSRSLKVAVARTDDIAAKYGAGAEGVAKLVKRVGPKFLLLAGDADTVPTFVCKSSYVSDRFASDPDLATDYLYGAVTGRFPADTVEELQSMAARTVEYETTLPAGRWQKRISFVTGEANFGTLIDDVLERQFNSVVTGKIPMAYDIETAYAKPASKYCFYPPKFGANALRMINDGALFFAYVGHGYRDGFDDVRFKDEVYPILEKKHVRDIDVREGLPIMVVIACSTGEFDASTDCIGEMIYKRRRGPVAFIGGSRVTQPYGNGLLGNKLVEQIFARKSPTLGEALWQAKAAVVDKDDSALRLQADAIASTIQGPGSLEPMRTDVVRHYNLFGDPALKIRRPAEDIELTPRGFPGPGRTFFVTGQAGDGPIDVTIECARDKFFHPTNLEGQDLEAQIGRRYANANNKVIVRSPTSAAEGRFEIEMELPESLKPGKYFLKAYGPGSIGSRILEIQE
jgi:peptidase C25-like protein